MKRITVGVLALALCGCSATPESTFNDMKKAACAGDVQGFFLRVNRTRVEEDLLAKSLRDHPLSEDELAAAKPQLEKSVHETIDEWSDDIKKGDTGALCKMTFVSDVTASGAAKIFWKTESGRDKYFDLEKFGDKWIVVAVGENNGTAAPPEAPRPPRREAPTAEPSGVTLAAYSQLKTDMTYEQAVAILGSKGTEMSRSDVAGITMVMYSWQGSGGLGANMNATFQNNKLISKAQLGLR